MLFKEKGFSMSDITLLEEISEQELDNFYGGMGTVGLTTGTGTNIIIRIPKIISKALPESCEVK